MRKYFDSIRRIAGNVVTVNAMGVSYDELATIESSHGESLAQVIDLEGQQVSLQVFSGSQGVSNNDRVRFLQHPMQVPFSDDLLGRVFDLFGQVRFECRTDKPGTVILIRHLARVEAGDALAVVV